MMKQTKSAAGVLSSNHPGAKDRAYIQRRNFIARQGKKFLKNPKTIPRIRYTAREHKTWETVFAGLEPLHKKFAARSYMRAKKRLGIRKDHVVQLVDLNRKLRKLNGFRVEPVGGKATVRWFLGRMADRTMVATQYVRHHSRPDFSPEPDTIHEIIGHAPMFGDREFAALSQRLGAAVLKANKTQLRKIERLYWYVFECGLMRENGTTKAFGAALLSSIGELNNAFSKNVRRKRFSIKEVTKTLYNDRKLQEVLFVAPSFKALRRDIEKFLEKEGL